MLIKYEFLKILRKKSTLIVMAASLILTGFLFGLPIMQFQTYNQNGVLKGADGIAYEKGQYADLSVPLSEEYVAETIREVQGLFENPDNIGYDGNEQFLIGDAYWNGVAPREKLLNLIANTYSKPNEILGYNNLPDLDINGGASFYQTMERKIQNLLNNPSRKLSNEQKEYWGSMAEKVDTPLQYGYYEGWEVIISSFELLMFALLAICIVVAPVFSGEYQEGTDAVILSAKYGKTKLTTAKIAASLLFGTAAFILHVVVACGLPLAAFGADGWNLPLQIANTAIPYPLTFLQAVLINIGIIYLVLLAMVGLTLLLSAQMKSPYLVLIILVPILFIPMFLTPNGTTGAYNLTLFLLPYRSTMPEFSTYISYQFGSLILDTLTIRAILYVFLTVIMLPLARLGFKNHQVA
ncbi:MAG: ABC transporter permease subunit [Lachnospiraceae bacterium]|nr:ABC transporter permease subunit [Lachnospiraceae bacterium]